MAAIAGPEWARPSFSLSPDTASPHYPDRPIRPLPRRRIRSRLSVEQADSINYPPIPPSSSPLFGSPQSQSERSFANPHYSGKTSAYLDEHHHEHICECGDHHAALDSDEDEELKGSLPQRYSWPGNMMKYPREYFGKLVTRSQPPPPKSSTSSADGYESFENTNNKKKRKIPISGASGMSVTSDGTSMSIPTQSVDVSEDHLGKAGQNTGLSSSAYYQGSGIGISGAGRGRGGRSAGRSTSERKPLSVSAHVSNNLTNGIYPDHPGIISAAIADAEEKGAIATPQGQENVSLLQRHSQSSASVPKDFTFECPSTSSDKLNLSPRPVGAGSHVPRVPLGGRPMNQGTQPASNGGMLGSISAPPKTKPPAAQYGENQPMPPPRKAKPRRPGHALLIAAQQRKEQQRTANYHTPPKTEEIWLCEFCEYESIFGRPPTALVLQYEKKAQREQRFREAARRKREKLKAKGNRKNRKNTKSNYKAPITGSSDQLPVPSHPYDPRYDQPQDDSQEEDFFDGGYDDPADLPPDIDRDLNSFANPSAVNAMSNTLLKGTSGLG